MPAAAPRRTDRGIPRGIRIDQSDFAVRIRYHKAIAPHSQPAPVATAGGKAALPGVAPIGGAQHRPVTTCGNTQAAIERHIVEVVAQPAALLLPGTASVGGTKEEPAGARDPAFVGIGHVNAVEVGGGPGILCGPGAASVTGLQDSATAAHGPTIIAVGEKQVVKHGVNARALGGPVFPAVGGMQQAAVGPAGPAGLGIGEVGRAELGGGGRRLGFPALSGEQIWHGKYKKQKDIELAHL